MVFCMHTHCRTPLHIPKGTASQLPIADGLPRLVARRPQLIVGTQLRQETRHHRVEDALHHETTGCFQHKVQTNVHACNLNSFISGTSACRALHVRSTGRKSHVHARQGACIGAYMHPTCVQIVKKALLACAQGLRGQRLCGQRSAIAIGNHNRRGKPLQPSYLHDLAPGGLNGTDRHQPEPARHLQRHLRGARQTPQHTSIHVTLRDDDDWPVVLSSACNLTRSWNMRVFNIGCSECARNI